MAVHASSNEDPLAVLASWLDRMDVTSRQTNESLHRNERNRLSLLVLHGVAAVVIAPLFALQTAGPTGMSSPSFVAIREIPNAPYTLAFLLGLGGLILVPATVSRHRPSEMVGLAMLAAWYLVLAVGFGMAVGVWASAGHPATARPSLYAPGVYAHLAIIMFVHMVTLARLDRTARRSP